MCIAYLRANRCRSRMTSYGYRSIALRHALHNRPRMETRYREDLQAAPSDPKIAPSPAGPVSPCPAATIESPRATSRAQDLARSRWKRARQSSEKMEVRSKDNAQDCAAGKIPIADF